MSIYTSFKARHSGMDAGMTVNYICVDTYALWLDTGIPASMTGLTEVPS
ncbi:MAG: hypothetical protein HOP02_10050 [Methylococcaceae bacterium]|nr:hypothetical protein [Methylococcaceae bacterium]